MHHTKFGPHRPARFQALPRDDDVRPAVRRGPEHGDHGCRGGRRDRFPRHRRRLSAGRRPQYRGPDRADRRRLAEGQAPPVHRRHQVRRPDGTEALGPRHVAQAHPRRDRRLAAAPRHRLCRSLPAARLRPAHADRRGAGGARHGRPRGQGALRRRFQLAGLQGRPGAGPQRGEEHRPHRVRSSRATICCSAAFERDLLPLCAGGSDRGDSLQSAGRRAAHRQARPQRTAAGRLALHARHRRRALPGALLARAGVRDHRGAARTWPRRPA